MYHFFDMLVRGGRIHFLYINYIQMKTQINIPRELLAEIDFNNTVDGGRIDTVVTSRTTHNCCYLIVKAPAIDPEKVKVQIVNHRLTVFISINILEGVQKAAHYLANVPISSNIDVSKIQAYWGSDGQLHIKAPFKNDWKYGNPNDINIRLS